MIRISVVKLGFAMSIVASSAMAQTTFPSGPPPAPAPAPTPPSYSTPYGTITPSPPPATNPGNNVTISPSYGTTGSTGSSPETGRAGAGYPSGTQGGVIVTIPTK